MTYDVLTERCSPVTAVAVVVGGNGSVYEKGRFLGSEKDEAIAAGTGTPSTTTCPIRIVFELFVFVRTPLGLSRIGWSI